MDWGNSKNLGFGLGVSELGMVGRRLVMGLVETR